MDDFDALAAQLSREFVDDLLDVLKARLGDDYFDDGEVRVEWTDRPIIHYKDRLFFRDKHGQPTAARMHSGRVTACAQVTPAGIPYWIPM